MMSAPEAIGMLTARIATNGQASAKRMLFVSRNG
jgi:hypothetical protein